MLIGGVKLKVGDTVVSSRDGSIKFIIPKAFSGSDDTTDDWLLDQILKNEIPDIYKSGVWFFRVIKTIGGDYYEGTIYKILNVEGYTPRKRTKKKKIYRTIRRP